MSCFTNHLSKAVHSYQSIYGCHLPSSENNPLSASQSLQAHSFTGKLSAVLGMKQDKLCFYSRTRHHHFLLCDALNSTKVFFYDFIELFLSLLVLFPPITVASWLILTAGLRQVQGRGAWVWDNAGVAQQPQWKTPLQVSSSVDRKHTRFK